MADLQQCYAIRSDEVAGKVIDGEAIIMNLADGSYYSLDGAGAMAWEQLQAGRSLGQLAQALARAYQVERSRAEQDAARIAEELVQEGLLVLTTQVPPSDPGAVEPDPPAGGRSAYEPPVLRKFTDMADLLALDPPMPGFDETPWARPDAPGNP